MTFYILYYISIFVMLMISYINKRFKFLLFMVISLTIFISGFRHNVGYDYGMYRNYFLGLDNREGIEPLFQFLIYIFQQFFSEPQILFFFYSFFTIIILWYAIKKFTIYIRTSFLIYLLIPGLYVNTFSIIRQGLSESIMFLAVYYYIRNKNYHFIFLSIIAGLFHYAAFLVAFILVFLKYFLFKNYKTLVYISFIIISLILYQLNFTQLLLSFLVGRYSEYLVLDDKVPLIKVFVINFFVLFIVYMKDRIIRNKQDLVVFNLFVLGNIIINLFADFLPVARLSYYFIIFQIIIVSNLIYSFKGNYTKIAMLLLFLCYFFLMLINAFINDINAISDFKLIPYNNYFFED